MKNRSALVMTMVMGLGCGTTNQTEGGAVEVAMGMIAPQNSLTVSVLDAWVDETVFAAESETAGEVTFVNEQMVAVDVKTGTADPDLIPVSLSEGTYSSVSLSVEVWDSGGEPAIYLEGDLQGVPIEFVFNSSETFEATADTLVVTTGAVQTVSFQLDPGAWFGGINAASLTLDGNGVAVISETSNRSAFDIIADRLDVTTQALFPGGSGEDPNDEI